MIAERIKQGEIGYFKLVAARELELIVHDNHGVEKRYSPHQEPARMTMAG